MMITCDAYCNLYPVEYLLAPQFILSEYTLSYGMKNPSPARLRTGFCLSMVVFKLIKQPASRAFRLFFFVCGFKLLKQSAVILLFSSTLISFFLGRSC